MKIAINRCYGGFSLSRSALERLGAEIEYEVSRHDPRLIAMIESGEDIKGGSSCELHLVEWPDNVPYYVVQDDGWERVEVNLHEILCRHKEEIEQGDSPLFSILKSLIK